MSREFEQDILIKGFYSPEVSVKDFSLFLDWRNEYIHTLGTTSWVTVYQNRGLGQSSDGERCTIFSAFIPESRLSEVRSTVDWDTHIGYGIPSLVSYDQDGESLYEYYSFNNEGEIIPLIHIRTFSGARPKYVEVLEEFRLFHNLYHNTADNIYVKFLEDGSERLVAKVSNDKVQIQLKELKQFLAARRMVLAIYFDVNRWHIFDVDAIQPSDRQINHKETNLLYKFLIKKIDEGMSQNYTSFSRFRGKKLIHGSVIEDSKAMYEKFIIAVDQNGNEIEFSSNPDELNNQFGESPTHPRYLTKVFFRKEILQRYHNEPEKYSVEDGALYCQDFWYLYIDNHHPNYVIVFLGDLGNQLPYTEQKIWRAYNVPPDGGLSEVSYRRAILGEFVDATDPLLRFKADYKIFQEKWYKKFGWYLFKPVNENDEYHFNSLRIPLSNNFSEFDSAILSLTKILIDSLNESKIAKEIRQPIPDDTKGIGKFELYLIQEGVDGADNIIEFMKQLQRIRSSSSAHRKSSNFAKDMSKIGLDLNNLENEFTEIIKKSIQLLDLLNNHFMN